MSLTYRQRMFVAYYTGQANGNASRAAAMAGYAWPDRAGAKLVVKGSIRAAIEAKVASVAMSQDEVLARISEIAAASLMDFLNDRGAVTTASLRRAKKRGKGHLLKRLRCRDGEVDVELESKSAALFKLGEHYGLWSGTRPPDISLVELARRLKEKLEGDGR